MEDNEKPTPPTRARTNTSETASRKSSMSRAASPNPALITHAGDQSQHNDHEQVENDDSDDDATIDEKDDDDEDATDLELRYSKDIIIPEVRGGIENQRDVEANPRLEKLRSLRRTRSARDPNLVTWDGDNDPANPKRWSFKHKWAAALIGKFDPWHQSLRHYLSYSTSNPSRLWHSRL